MAMIRACSYKATIKTPLPPSNYSSILVTLNQNGQNLVTKTKSQLSLGDDAVTLELTQAETALFSAPGKALLQIRCYRTAYDAPGSMLWPIDVYPVNDERILS